MELNLRSEIDREGGRERERERGKQTERDGTKSKK